MFPTCRIDWLPANHQLKLFSFRLLEKILKDLTWYFQHINKVLWYDSKTIFHKISNKLDVSNCRLQGYEQLYRSLYGSSSCFKNELNTFHITLSGKMCLQKDKPTKKWHNLIDFNKIAKENRWTGTSFQKCSTIPLNL